MTLDRGDPYSLMRYVRFSYPVQPGLSAYGVLEGEVVHELAGPPFSGERRTGRSYELDEVRLLAPCQPSKVLAVGLNYRSHLRGRPEPERPGLFAKLPSAVIGHGDPIVIPRDASDVHYEGELVVVIGRQARRVDAASALECIFGVTAGNDVSERNWQRDDLQWLRAKASDTFAPLGPVVATGLDYGDLQLETRVNGEVRQRQRTSDFIFSAPEIVEFASRYVTLLPGDVIYTGTPGNTAPLSPGDVVEVEVEGVGVLRSPVTEESP